MWGWASPSPSPGILQLVVISTFQQAEGGIEAGGSGMKVTGMVSRRDGCCQGSGGGWDQVSDVQENYAKITKFEIT